MDISNAKDMNSVDAIKNFILENVQKYLRDKEKEFGPELMDVSHESYHVAGY
ncbi:MAG: hypothetical protein MZV70_27815 [Desulfobacterales bacterium]|nr:hypothetical protein [Desulfobacterales bacterium]